MKSIDTLIPDIQNGFREGFKHLTTEGTSDFGREFAEFISVRLSQRQEGPPSLRMSNLGTACDRKLWYSINRSEIGEPLEPSARFKFLYGDILELLVLFLAKATGHTVTDEQREVEINGVKGHIDGIIDGHLVDLKSASTYSFSKFKAGLTPETDNFGYLIQLGAYSMACGHDTASFVVVDKTLGHICLDTHKFGAFDYEKEIERKLTFLSRRETPTRAYTDEPDGASGNRKLGITCSYCAFKQDCWPGLRTFLYSNGPRFLTQVKRPPNVPEA